MIPCTGITTGTNILGISENGALLEIGAWGEAPHTAVFPFREKKNVRFLEVPLC